MGSLAMGSYAFSKTATFVNLDYTIGTLPSTTNTSMHIEFPALQLPNYLKSSSLLFHSFCFPLERPFLCQ